MFSPVKQKTAERQELTWPQMPNFLTSIVKDTNHMISLSIIQILGMKKASILKSY